MYMHGGRCIKYCVDFLKNCFSSPSLFPRSRRSIFAQASSLCSHQAFYVLTAISLYAWSGSELLPHQLRTLLHHSNTLIFHPYLVDICLTSCERGPFRMTTFTTFHNCSMSELLQYACTLNPRQCSLGSVPCINTLH